MSGSSRPWSVLVSVLLLCLAPRAAAAQESPGVLTVTVRSEATQRPLAGAQVLVQGGIRGVTNEAGVVRLDGLPAGARVVGVRFLGFRPEETTVVIPVSTPASVSFDLVAEPVELSPIRVVARDRSPLLRNGFYDRQRSGLGVFVTRDDIEKVQPMHLSDVLRRIPGVTLTPTIGGMARASIRGATATCLIQYFVDGTQTWGLNIDDVNAEDVEGLEIYKGAATIPPEYKRGSASCGVILIWTRLD